MWLPSKSFLGCGKVEIVPRPSIALSQEQCYTRSMHKQCYRYNTCGDHLWRTLEEETSWPDHSRESGCWN